MLTDAGSEYTYREYTEEPLTRTELDGVFARLGMVPRELLRSRDAKALGLRGDESDEELLDLMAQHPTLLQRPILDDGQKAVLGRPVENLHNLL